MSVQVKIKNDDGSQKSEFNFRKIVQDDPEPEIELNKMNVQEGSGIVPITESDIPDLEAALQRLIQELTQPAG